MFIILAALAILALWGIAGTVIALARDGYRRTPERRVLPRWQER